MAREERDHRSGGERSSHREAVVSALGDGARFGARIAYSTETTLRGTAGALRHARRLLGHGPFLVVYADNIFDLDLRPMRVAHRASHAAVTMAVLHRSDVSASGLVSLSDDGRVNAFEEKPQRPVIGGGWVSAGLLVCARRVLRVIPRGPADIGRDVLPELLRRHELVLAHRISDDRSVLWIDTPADLMRTRDRMRSR